MESAGPRARERETRKTRDSQREREREREGSKQREAGSRGRKTRARKNAVQPLCPPKTRRLRQCGGGGPVVHPLEHLAFRGFAVRRVFGRLQPAGYFVRSAYPNIMRRSLGRDPLHG